MYYFSTIFHPTANVCDDVPMITNGRITYTMVAPRPIGTMAIYECEAGYRLEGDSIRTCQDDGDFDGMEPRCVLIRKRLILAS